MGTSKIRILSEEVANRIAAGEVVERPASVVKELVENAVDAGARHVAVRVWGAGKARIVVEDDGCGMSRADAETSLRRHATSKIAQASDLDRIATLGFRGEALPSIASVSRLQILTREAGELEATRVAVDGGRVEAVEAAAGAKGTRIEVSDLFSNVPARRKFLKTDATELRNVVEAVQLLALVHPSVGFELASEGRALLALPPGQEPARRAAEIAALPGREALYWHEAEQGDWRLSFAFAAPHEGQGSRKGLRLFVNRRAVGDRLLFRAVMDAYRGRLEAGRQPIAFLWLTLPPDEVDVNVHPAKREVRFCDEGRVFRWVASQVSRALAEAPWAKGPGEDAAAWGGGVPSEDMTHSASGVVNPAGERVARVADALASLDRAGPWGAGSETGRSRPPTGGGYRPAAASVPSRPFSVPLALGPSAGGGAFAAPDDAIDTVFGRLRYLGAFDATYLLFEDAQARELLIVDQHAAHERILFEALSRRMAAGTASQPLLVPVVVECTAQEQSLWPDRMEELRRLGFRAEPFGGRSLSVVEAPPGFSAAEITAVVHDLFSAESPEEADLTAGRERALAARAACAAAVKARSALDPSEVRELLEGLRGLENPSHCPHGRPLVARLSRARLETLFLRR